ncbi:hypothetical protein Ancab_036362 [Ancistrocladus abbreviatus]
MKGRENRGPPPADLLVCFPSRAHLTLMPKPICSPARPSESNTHYRRRRPHQPHLNKSSTSRGGGGGSSNGGQGGTPLFWAKSKQMSGDDQEIAEPSSPKVTCAGQIKVRHKSSACRNWQSVMEEIERIHNNRKQRKKPNWAESLGFKKEIMQFLTCLRAVRFNFRCFGSFPAAVISSDEEEEEEDDDDDEEGDEDEIYHGSHQLGTEGGEEKGGSSRTVFSKWFMVLDENQNSERKKFGERERFSSGRDDYDDGLDDETSMPPPPPPNALLLMRCRSAPAKSWLEETEEEKEGKLEEEREKEEGKGKNIVEEETKEKKRESLAIVMRYDTDFYKLSTDIAEETWVVGGLKDPLSRSRSWKR